MRLLYGPLLACVTASKSAFTAMVQQHGDGDTASFVRAARENPEGPQGKIYRCALAGSPCCMEAQWTWHWGEGARCMREATSATGADLQVLRARLVPHVYPIAV